MVAIHKEKPQPFVVSAPGKVILFGEHAVVYGKAAIASSLDMRAYALVTPRKDGKVRLFLPDVNVDIIFDTEALARVDVGVLGHPTEVETLVPEAIEIPEGPGRTAVLAFVYLYCGVFADTGAQSVKGFTICVRSLLPVGSGLGSSAALNVTLSAALLRLRGRIGPDVAKAEDKQLINEWAFRGEQVAHGTPSGIDNSVATFGGFLRYTKGQSAVNLASSQALHVLITNTNVPKSTKALVAGVRMLRDKFPTVIDPLLESIHGISMRAAELFQSAETASKDCTDAQIDELEAQLRDIIRINHGLLATLGVSHPSLERIREITAAGGLASKLTGSGGGGCALTLVPHNASGSKTEAKVVADLESEGFQCYRTAVGGFGVGIAHGVGADTVERWIGSMLDRHMSLVPSNLSSGGIARMPGDDEYAGIVSGFSILPSSVMAMLAPQHKL
ncbi:Mevalonate kinase [Coemansia sp. RSA 1813]|nr:Mevalonate kinase [Coemansia sp. RSA 1646]KAJ1768142.1 Mevalonate kinase [Coemansia sp. RSA 1843]KAJ2093360.1 Mevalonate kinase [Coemansia sp. RSA 986]KAJ2217169.1 Mevalonate kinase [Coemansia sp. RSA 487]KAJ2572367.1 Mevalonate kinase [Coemansia sp. RSA 1813]